MEAVPSSTALFGGKHLFCLTVVGSSLVLRNVSNLGSMVTRNVYEGSVAAPGANPLSLSRLGSSTSYDLRTS